jgi:hypothetical protein
VRPAHVQIVRDHLLERSPIRIVTRAKKRREQGQSAKKADVWVDARRGKHGLGMPDVLLDIRGVPDHLFRQGCQRCEDPEVMIPFRYAPEARAWLLADDQHLGQLRVGYRRLGHDRSCSRSR